MNRILLIPFLLFLLRPIGRFILKGTPRGGIHEEMYVPINGTKQWISIYGKKKDNPVLLYLHGGPGASTSSYDYAFTRKWADVYTVVTWDQRNCGKSLSGAQNHSELTYALFMADGLEMTKFLLDYLGKEKLTILGHSWGTIFGCNLVLAYPEYYDCYIGTGQLVDFCRNEAAFFAEASKWTEKDPEGRALLQKLTVGDFSWEYRMARNELMKKYGFDMFADGRDYSLPPVRKIPEIPGIRQILPAGKRRLPPFPTTTSTATGIIRPISSWRRNILTASARPEKKCT